MRTWRTRFLSVALLLTLVSAGAAAEGREAEGVARAFGSTLAGADANALRTLFPTEGRVRLALRVLGPADGLFGSGQAEAIFRDLLAKTAVRSFEVLRVESDGRTGGLAVLRLAVTDPEGHARRIGLRLTLEPERGRWVVREVRETPE